VGSARPQLVEKPFPLPDYVPEAIAGVIMRMLALDPGDRPTAAEATEALEPLAADVAA